MGTRGDGWRRWDRAADRLWALIGWVLLPIGCVFVLVLAVQDVGPSWRAFQGKGTPGVFVVRINECGRAGCTANGDFTSADGSLVRRNVVLDTTKRHFTVGQQIQARDSGDRAIVYDAAGGLDWLLTPAFVVGALVALGFWARAVVRRFGPRSKRAS